LTPLPCWHCACCITAPTREEEIDGKCICSWRGFCKMCREYRHQL